MTTVINVANTAYFAAGCFWGVEHLLGKQPGVLSTAVGYMGGILENPTYRDVCEGDSGHAETVRVMFDPVVVTYEQLCRLFFEIHDFTQVDRQGPDFGDQYRSEIFVTTPDQQKTAEAVLAELVAKGYSPATKVTPVGEHVFWPAEDYHQDYYAKTGKRPYCHARKRIF